LTLRFRRGSDSTSTASVEAPCALSLRNHVRVGLGHEDQVRLDDVVLREDDVERRDKDLAAAVGFHVEDERERELEQNPLMTGRRGRRHAQLPVEELVADAAVGQGGVVTVGELRH
jgi:hypothetical protein